MKLLYPHKLLFKKAQPINNTENTKTLEKNMKNTLKIHKGIGLAATQIGTLKRIIILKVKKKLITITNPKIIYKSVELFPSHEGCLSIPNYFKTIKRHKFIKIQGEIAHTAIEITVKNNIAACLQHEIDHLNGKLIKQLT
ncbi:peptide deformylase [Candidatus Vidania fulgoroideae]|nr:peptide deformylase [Candidatus Vidania fulgoroideae]